MMKDYQCEPCGAINFISTMDTKDCWRFTDVLDKMNFPYYIVCDSCKYKILYEYYFKLSYRIHDAVKEAMENENYIPI